MKTSILIATAALAASGAAFAKPVTRTTTYDGPKVDATRVAVRDQTAGPAAAMPPRPAPATARRHRVTPTVGAPTQA